MSRYKKRNAAVAKRKAEEQAKINVWTNSSGVSKEAGSALNGLLRAGFGIVPIGDPAEETKGRLRKELSQKYSWEGIFQNLPFDFDDAENSGRQMAEVREGGAIMQFINENCKKHFGGLELVLHNPLILKSNPGCPLQAIHRDFPLLDRTGCTQLFCVMTMEQDSQLRVVRGSHYRTSNSSRYNAELVDIPAWSLVIFHQHLHHSGAAFRMQNIRLHFVLSESDTAPEDNEVAPYRPRKKRKKQTKQRRSRRKTRKSLRIAEKSSKK